MNINKEILTTFEAARYCHVHPGTIKNWIRKESLKAFKTPGGHRRIYKKDLDKFLQDKSIPARAAHSGLRQRVLIVEREYKNREEISKLLHRWQGLFEITAVSNGFEAGEMLIAFKPELVIIDPALSGLEPDELCDHIRNVLYPDTVRIVALNVDQDENESMNADSVLEQPLEIMKLKQELEKLLEINKPK
jgi:excisionase family DNA binding protein